MESLLELLGGKGATPDAIEASIRAMVQDEMSRILAAAQSAEQTALDREAVILDHLMDRVKTDIIPTLVPLLNEAAKERETQFLDRMEAMMQSYKIGFTKMIPQNP